MTASSMLDWIARRVTGTRRGRYWLRKISQLPALQGVIDDRTPACLRLLGALGFQPDLVVDVGAYQGEWTAAALPIFPSAHFVMLEAQPDKLPALRRVQQTAEGRIDCVQALLGAEAKASTTFFLAETGSSVYAEATSFPQKAVTLPMQTLDGVMAAVDRPGTCLLKMDVQGAELDVLAGAPATLARTAVVLLEASLVEYNHGAPRVREVIDRLGDLGFILFDICDLHRIDSVLAQVDLIFVRPGSPLDRAAQRRIAAFGR